MPHPKMKAVIVGAGFGGIKTALELSNNRHFSVTLISDSENFRYYPTLFKAATGNKMAAASIPLTEIFDGRNVGIVKDSMSELVRDKKQIKTKSGKVYKYDYLIVALGVVTNYFGIKGLKEYSYGIKTQDEANELRQHIHKLLVDEGKPDSNYVVIGGGPTGVELAGALPAYIRHIMRSHKIKNHKLHIDLVEAAPKLLPRMDKYYSRAVTKRLRKLGVKLFLNQTVQAATAEELMVSDHPIESHTVIWTAGVTNHPFLKKAKFTLDDHGKVAVNEYLESEPNIFVIGDNASTPFSGMAQTALHNAAFVAHNLKLLVRGHRMERYKPKNPFYVTPVGPQWAAVQYRQFHIYGWLGWMMRTAADFMGYRDYEPWWKASAHWIDEMQNEAACPVCK